MTDYYPAIAKSIAGLGANASAENRRALYDRARAELQKQLRSFEPPYSEFEITQERLSLERAVRKVEEEELKLARKQTSRHPSLRTREDLERNREIAARKRQRGSATASGRRSSLTRGRRGPEASRS